MHNVHSKVPGNLKFRNFKILSRKYSTTMILCPPSKKNGEYAQWFNGQELLAIKIELK